MTPTPTHSTSPVPLEKHYTINELADVLSMSFERVRQLVMNEPGVLVFEPTKLSNISRRAGTRTRRRTYRIPASVLHRILRRCANPAAA